MRQARSGRPDWGGTEQGLGAAESTVSVLPVSPSPGPVLPLRALPRSFAARAILLQPTLSRNVQDRTRWDICGHPSNPDLVFAWERSDSTPGKRLRLTSGEMCGRSGDGSETVSFQSTEFRVATEAECLPTSRRWNPGCTGPNARKKTRVRDTPGAKPGRIWVPGSAGERRDGERRIAGRTSLWPRYIKPLLLGLFRFNRWYGRLSFRIAGKPGLVGFGGVRA
jgi:hypothetical protein